LFVIDGAKALRCAIEEVFGGDQPVQRCRNHFLGNFPLWSAKNEIRR
jgi:transposase-like protein